jgi:hypothetical protein
MGAVDQDAHLAELAEDRVSVLLFADVEEVDAHRAPRSAPAACRSRAWHQPTPALGYGKPAGAGSAVSTCLRKPASQTA